ncbi:DUF309 domain-containing protein [Tuwongella immobilis]|uniref:DUF309 domain-containing protein n=1 Tax=Tuwongella immobilis TaxID=692036 RepID=A0A6C2YGT7_9BACT|nr:DUF309 domain-containing protein [Tuwongella immobilis]VIP00627.1 Marine sediment metagenome DNA, contig: S01H1_S22954 OS=marine sediment metagenome GN=S01H1_57815 PE=4 SV=1: DUF309 [Tuwongella immobilis]VTR96672.1 Marine sediment metagenome DNA, contig: S01H1_S22954 OS=marine sediment metagenome GN=S01H1_57815 PE=4 SV=1: DUF309 [Tuwongella immobilis]
MTTPEEYDARYLRGILEFNRGEFFEAHEIWEELWRDCPAEPRRFVQGLIQAAVAIYHANRGNRAGCARLYQSARAYMLRYESPYWGLDIGAFWQAMEQCLAPWLATESSWGFATGPTCPLPRIALQPPPTTWPNGPSCDPEPERPMDEPL